MNAPALPEIDRDGATETRLDHIGRSLVDEAKEGIRSDIAAIKRQIEDTPIAADILRLRAALVQRPGLTELEVQQLGFLAREGLGRIQTKHYRRLEDVNLLIGILMDIGVDPQMDNGRVEVSCMSASDMMNIGNLIMLDSPRVANAIIEAAKYDAVRMVVFWNSDQIERERRTA